MAGRSLASATEFCAGVANTEPLAADRNHGIAALLADVRPDLLIDAAGPFQGSGYHVPLACTHAGVPYLDLADARDFVRDIGTLDEAAKAAGVALVSGASSVPALSGAIARHLARDMQIVRSVETAISASNKATGGRSVAAAILSYVGRPLRLWRGRRWTKGWGWQELRRADFEVSNVPRLKGRWLALADVPDHDLMPAMLPGRPAVTFRAGTDIAIQTLSLWLLSWPVRWLRHVSLRPLAILVPWLQRPMRAFASDRSAMRVELTGVAEGRAIARRWTLIAEAGHGPEIPTLAAALLTEAILNGRVPAGARSAEALLDLDDFEPLFAELAIHHEVVEVEPARPLYERVIGSDFAKLPRVVRDMHRVYADAGASGKGSVQRGKSLLAGLLCRLFGFPPDGEYPLHVAFSEHEGAETWERSFGPHRFASRMVKRGVNLAESFGPMQFEFELPSNGDGLVMALRGWNCLGVPLPMALAPKVGAREWQQDEVFRFEVDIALPFIGPLIRYSGWLVPEA